MTDSKATVVLAEFKTAIEAVNVLEAKLNKHIEEYAAFYLNNLKVASHSRGLTPYPNAFNGNKWTLVPTMCTGEFFRFKKGKDVFELPVAFIDDPENWKSEVLTKIRENEEIARNAAATVGVTLNDRDYQRIATRYLSGTQYVYVDCRSWYINVETGLVYTARNGIFTLEKELQAGTAVPMWARP